jgi:hypothetical protein
MNWLHTKLFPNNVSMNPIDEFIVKINDIMCEKKTILLFTWLWV